MRTGNLQENFTLRLTGFRRSSKACSGFSERLETDIDQMAFAPDDLTGNVARAKPKPGIPLLLNDIFEIRMGKSRLLEHFRREDVVPDVKHDDCLGCRGTLPDAGGKLVRYWTGYLPNCV